MIPDTLDLLPPGNLATLEDMMFQRALSRHEAALARVRRAQSELDQALRELHSAHSECWGRWRTAVGRAERKGE